MYNESQLKNGYHLSSEKADKIYLHIEEEKQALKQSIGDLQQSVQSIKSDTANFIHNPIKALSGNISVSQVINERPFASIVATVGLGIVAGLLMRKEGYQKFTAKSGNIDSEQTYVVDPPAVPILDKIEKEIRKTTSLVIEEIFLNVRLKAQNFFETLKQ